MEVGDGGPWSAVEEILGRLLRGKREGGERVHDEVQPQQLHRRQGRCVRSAGPVAVSFDPKEGKHGDENSGKSEPKATTKKVRRGLRRIPGHGGLRRFEVFEVMVKNGWFETSLTSDGRQLSLDLKGQTEAGPGRVGESGSEESEGNPDNVDRRRPSQERVTVERGEQSLCFGQTKKST